MARQKKSDNAVDNLCFEDALEKLEGIVKEMEKGDLKLEDSLTLFSQGVVLSQLCLGKLNTAEKEIDTLLQKEQGKWIEKKTVFSGEGD